MAQGEQGGGLATEGEEKSDSSSEKRPILMSRAMRDFAGLDQASWPLTVRVCGTCMTIFTWRFVCLRIGSRNWIQHGFRTAYCLRRRDTKSGKHTLFSHTSTSVELLPNAVRCVLLRAYARRWQAGLWGFAAGCVGTWGCTQDWRGARSSSNSFAFCHA